ncbi:hypothetical protein PCL_09968 [Purpureocillium lilacinum]|uniref:Uncharacterized protein n=1 Tax=Purpureocillium lilacinum TaxID=33203 RepID=A0A2U3EES3_PURLI|nr:hypothetical protein PCL_09968 [Purpureocillium lilacinum]
MPNVAKRAARYLLHMWLARPPGTHACPRAAMQPTRGTAFMRDPISRDAGRGEGGGAVPANAAVHSAWGHQRKLRGAPNDTTATDVNGRVLKYGIQCPGLAGGRADEPPGANYPIGNAGSAADLGSGGGRLGRAHGPTWRPTKTKSRETTTAPTVSPTSEAFLARTPLGRHPVLPCPACSSLIPWAWVPPLTLVLLG